MIRGKKEETMNTLLIALNAPGISDDFIIVSFEDIKESHDFQKSMRDALKGVLSKYQTAYVTSILLGSLPSRNLDLKKEYKVDWNVYDLLEE